MHQQIPYQNYTWKMENYLPPKNQEEHINISKSKHPKTP